jgi:nickel/cobalt exporter
MAGAGGETGDLTALPAAPAEPQDAEPAPPPAPQASGGPMARISAWQAAFNRDLTDALKALKDGGAFWWLGGVSFLYGIVHAAGPGHGKVVISSYLVANEAQVSRGVAIAFIAAFAQAVVAVGLIAVMAAILNMTSMAITGTAQLFEAGSFALVALLGLYLLARKGRDAWAVLSGGDNHAHHHHHGHGHLPSTSRGRTGEEGGERQSPAERLVVAARAVPPPSQVGAEQAAAHSCRHHALPAATRAGRSGAAAAILSVGIRPCSGALVVLVFALAQGVFWAGVASTFLMALGTAITVAALAALAVGAKDIARRLSRGDGSGSAHVMLGLEVAAALVITALGVVLFAGAISA